MNKSYKTDSFEFRINDISINELINHYNRVNFLYPEKKRDISVFLPLIEQNSKKGIEGKKTVTMGSFQQRLSIQKMATILLWRSTNNV